MASNGPSFGATIYQYAIFSRKQAAHQIHACCETAVSPSNLFIALFLFERLLTFGRAFQDIVRPDERPASTVADDLSFCAPGSIYGRDPYG